jgi:transposase
VRDIDFFAKLLGLKKPWRVSRVTLSPEEKEIDVWLEHRPHALFACPECRLPLPVYDHVAARRWRHLDHGDRVTWLHARIPRVYCLEHGARQGRVPWALPGSRFTLPFERHAIDVLLETDVLGGARVLKLSWDEAWHLMERAVERGQKAKQRRVIPYIGVDEKAVARRHQYVTMVCDLNRGTVEYLAENREKTSLDAYYASLSQEQLVGIQAVAMDMWEPYISSTVAHVPEGRSKIVFDRFHIMKHMNEAVDAVRKEENRLLLEDDIDVLKGTKYFWLFAEENLPEKMVERFAFLRACNLKTGRAWAIKESLRELWHYRRRGWAERFWQRWYFWATHCRLTPVKKVARMIHDHLENVLTYFDHRITNAVSEGLNSKIQTVKKTPTGFGTGTICEPPFSFTAAASICTRPRCWKPRDFPRRLTDRTSFLDKSTHKKPG